MKRSITRRTCLKSAAAAAGSIFILPGGLVRGYAANEAVNVGVIATGGRGGSNLNGVAGQPGVNIAALCEVDRRRLEHAAKRFPEGRTYTDYRKLLDEAKNLDAVVVSTPDHNHAPACVRAMKQGLHCYCEKPLTRDIHEARVMTQVAVDNKLVTHMGTGGRGSESTIRTVEVIRNGAIGQVTEAHFWTDRPWWPQGFDRPEGEDPASDLLDWEAWIGPAPMRPFKAKWPEGHPVYELPANMQRGGNVYHPFVWRGWWDFGTGALGDIAPHFWHTAYWGLELGAPESVEIVETTGPTNEMFPAACVLRFNFPARGDQPAMSIYWYDGGKYPPAELLGGAEPGLNGSAIVGTKAVLGPGRQSAGNFPDVPRALRRPADMYTEWIAGIKASDPDRPSCPFSYAGPLTEAYLLGNIALKVNRRIDWDPQAFRVTNCPEANQHLKAEYRPGWEL
ncbi:MAG: Gfo/Idh/MocA family oxidoreductase [Thermoguttaceae bacterium]|jgi:predicted dehydrogenase|nr:Gfo/Idh/MocA family oxidoreductase [Thermoguttaceae bacterium]